MQARPSTIIEITNDCGAWAVRLWHPTGMKLGIPQNYRFLIVVAAALIAVNVFISNRSAGDFEFEARQHPAGFQDLILSGGTSRPDPAAAPLAGVEFGVQQENAKPISDICTALFRDPADPTVGASDAAVTIVEFFDYQCPYCRVVSAFLGDIQAKDPRVRIVFKEWPILGPASNRAARAALAAARQGQYVRFHQALMKTRGIPTEALFRYAATEAGIDPDRLLRDLNAAGTSTALRRNDQLAKQLGFTGIPSFVVGRTIVQGAITRSELEKLIDLEAGAATPAVCRGG